ncbi:putative holin-like toxin [Rubeoparvulum massiliense]
MSTFEALMLSISFTGLVIAILKLTIELTRSKKDE